MKEWIKNAFAIESPENCKPSQEQKLVVDKICKEVVRRHLTTPALIFLESFRPLNYIGSQIMHYFQPIISAVLTGDGYQHFTEFIEQRGSVDYMCSRIEYFENLPTNKDERTQSNTDNSITKNEEEDNL